ncbi:hypothetical protein AWC00_00995 [Mycobacterium conspicuum]|nr:hypothetical protein AWC00_00995 [Mycobacterium conspicuum]
MENSHVNELIWAKHRARLIRNFREQRIHPLIPRLDLLDGPKAGEISDALLSENFRERTSLR